MKYVDYGDERIPVEEAFDRLDEEIGELQEENDKLNRQIIIMEKYFELICNIGYDYDGYSDTEHLKKLIDELVRFASLGRVCNDTEGIYIDNDNIYYNILNERIERGGKSEKDKD